MKELNKFIPILVVIFLCLINLFLAFTEKDLENELVSIFSIISIIFMEMYRNKSKSKKLDHIIRITGNTAVVVIILCIIAFVGINFGISIYKNGIKQVNSILVFITFLIMPPVLTFYLLYKIEHSSSKKQLFLKNKIYPQNIKPFRDLPFKDDFILSFFVAREYKLIKNDTDYIGALILYWAYLKKIDIISDDKNHYSIIFKDDITNLNEGAALIYSYLRRASTNNVLEPSEFQLYCQENDLEINHLLLENIIKPELIKLNNENKYVQTKKPKSFLNLINNEYYAATDILNEKAQELAGLKLFLNDFTITDTLKPEEIKMYQEYLIYGQILGVATASINGFTDLLHETNIQKVLDFMQDTKQDKSSLSDYFNSNFML